MPRLGTDRQDSMFCLAFFILAPAATSIKLVVLVSYDRKLFQKTLESISLMRSNIRMNEDEVWMWFEENWWEDFMHGDPEVEE